MITPGQITLELLIGPTIYYTSIYIIPPLLSALSAYVGDLLYDESLKNSKKKDTPEISPEQLSEVYEFEKIRTSLLSGLIAGIFVIYGFIPSGISLESAIAISVPTGLSARYVLSKAKETFINKANLSK